MWCKTQAVVALSSAEAELYGLVRASAETMGLTSMYEDLGTHMNGLVLGDASAALAIVARRGLDKLRHLNTNYLWIQEKAAKVDLNFKKVAGVDRVADLFTKTLSWNEIQSHIHKLSSECVQDEISVNCVGARPNGVDLPRILQEMGIAGGRNLAAWTRTDMSSRTRRTTMKGGPVWSAVVARVTADAVNGEILDSELARDITRSLEHTPLEGGSRDIQTILVFEVSKVKSPSPILQDSVRRGEYVDMESTMTGTPMTPDQKRLVSGPCWRHLYSRCQLFESLSPCCCHDVPCEKQWTHSVCWSVEELECFSHTLQ